MTLSDVQAILRHANIETTGRYLTVRVEDIFDKLQEHYSRPRPQRRTQALLEHLSSFEGRPGRNAGMPAVWTPAITPCTNSARTSTTVTT